MKLLRRNVLHLAAGIAVFPAVSRIVRAQSYPTRPVRIIVGFAPGSAGEIIARVVGQWLSQRFGQQFVVEAKPGAGGTVAAETVVRASPDGYTLLLCSSGDAINATLHNDLSFNFVRDVAPVASIAQGPLVLVVNPSFPAKTVAEFIAYAKANPGQVNFGSAGIGSITHLAGELFKTMAGVDLVHVPYRGLAPAITDLLGERVQAIFSAVPPAIAQVRAGKLRALAVTSAERAAALPDLPAVADFLPGYKAVLVTGIGAPKDTPAEIREKLNNEFNISLDDPEIKAQLANLGNEPVIMGIDEFGKFLVDETEKWAKVIKTAGIQAQ